MPQIENVSLGWREGRYFDRWMVVHFLVGVAGGFSNLYFALSVPMVFVVGSALMVLWEALEWTKGIREAWENRVLDVAIGLLGTGGALLVLARVDRGTALALFWVSAVLASIGEVLGWLAYRRRTAAADDATRRPSS